MNSYSVKQIATMLNTNPETVRRWIRSGKLVAKQDSRKGGNVICESALREFVKATPKYAGTTAAMLMGTAAISTMLIGGFVAHKISEDELLKKAHIASEDIKKFLLAEIDARKSAIVTKRKSISQLEAEVASEQKKIDELYSLVERLFIETEGGVLHDESE